MKILYWFVAAALALIAAFYLLNSYIYNEKQADVPDTSMNINLPVEVTPIEHATAVLQWGETTIYLDPTGGAEAFADQPSPTLVLITDIHGDHLDADTLSAVIGDATLIAPQAVKDDLPEGMASRVQVLANGEVTQAAGIRIEAVPMYNLPDADNSNFHTKGRGNGYVLEKDGSRVYIAGDTAGTPEMRAMENIDIAFVPMNLPYTMSVDEAADAVLAFKPKVAIPYHYRGPDGLADVNRFKELVNAGDSTIDVQLLAWYPNQ
jgi:L-ascorbate metabolism protein UlaG (beta-lactamase superfamily)